MYTISDFTIPLSKQRIMVKHPDINIQQPIGRILSRMGKRYLQLLNARLDYLDIERSYYALLLIEPQEGKITQKELAQQLESDKVSIVRIIDYLAAKGYVVRLKSPDDGRKSCLILTDKAKKALPGIRKAMDEISAQAFEGISRTRQAEFYQTLDAIKINLKNAGTIRKPGV